MIIFICSEESIFGSDDFVIFPLKYTANPVTTRRAATVTIINTAITPPLNPPDLLSLKCLATFDAASGFELEEFGKLEEGTEGTEGTEVREGTEAIFE